MIDWMAIAERLGIPFATLLMVLFAIWLCIKWIARTAIEPFVKNHLELINALIETNKRLVQTIERLTNASSK